MPKEKIIVIKKCPKCGEVKEHSAKGWCCKDCKRELDKNKPKIIIPKEVAKKRRKRKYELEYLERKARGVSAKEDTVFIEITEEDHKRLDRDLFLRNTYGITLNEWEEILLKQNNECAVCGTKTFTERGGIATDHCHITGGIRGILCKNCNAGIGLLKDNVVTVRKAVEYLDRYNESIESS